MGRDGPCLLGLARVRWGWICSTRNLQWNHGRGLGMPTRGESCNHASDGTSPAQGLRARAPDVCCASRTSTRPSATVAALAATVVGASSRRQPTTMAIATAQTPRSRRTTEATPSSGSRGCAGSRQASRRPRGVSHRTRDPSSESGCDLGCAHALDRRQPARGSWP